MNEDNSPVTIRRVDYTEPPFWIESVALVFSLDADSTLVSSTLQLKRNAQASQRSLKLDGVELELESIALNGQTLAASAYHLDEESLSLDALPDSCELHIVTRVYPAKNTALEGLYLSSGNYCTQCEAEGFRKITYYLDRPDVLATFNVRIEASLRDYPVLLSNGNKISSGELVGGRHYVEWFDPHPKPSYLFALVAGKLDSLSDVFVTCTGREVELLIYVEAHNLHKCDYAMQALIKSMRWDEAVFGLEYDLDMFMIVAVDDFNMGAMENKGLNIFNSRYVLADQQSATDSDFMSVEAVIAHEYFHNWTGNRVTCRDWFQLSLKEGLTVFRDQQFSADMNSRAVKRIEDVRLLRMRQFPEDAGPMAHPIRPDEYMEINNFYTVTVYEKGAEVIRMMYTLLGPIGFRRGIDLYFERFDGQAVTCDDFVQAMQDASGVELGQFRRWYSQAGTPVLDVSWQYDAKRKEFHLSVSQSCPPTPGQADKQPFHIPFRMALFDPDGEAMALHCDRCSEAPATELTLDITQPQSTFVFQQVDAVPVVSLLRNFSAPVIVNTQYSDTELAFLMAHDSDDFNRWDAGQRLYRRVIEKFASSETSSSHAALSLEAPMFNDFNRAFAQLLERPKQDPALLAAALTLPDIEAIAESAEVMQIDVIYAAIKRVKTGLARRYEKQLLQLMEQMKSTRAFSIDGNAIGQRSLTHACLCLLGSLPAKHWQDRVLGLLESANNMTDKIAALRVLCNSTMPQRDAALEAFYKQWSNDRLVIDKWFTLQALSEREDVVAQVKQLSTHPAFELSNPNRIRALIGAFAMSNTVGFHAADGQGYQLLADFVLKLDTSNPQIAARLVGPLGRWQRLDKRRQELMRAELFRILEVEGLSSDVYEIVTKSLDSVTSGAQRS